MSSIRLSPTESATLYKIGTKKKGNDGNIWIIKEDKNNVKRWKIYKKLEKNKKNSVDKSEKKIKIYDMPFESVYYEDTKFKNINIIDELSLTKIQSSMKKLTSENLLKYYRKYPFDTEDIVSQVKKAKLIFNAYTKPNRKTYVEIYIVPKKDNVIPKKTIINIKKWINGQISDGFGENGISIGKYRLYMSYKM